MKPDKQSLDAIKSQVTEDLAAMRARGETEALQSLETFFSIALRVFASTNPSKIRDAMRAEEIKHLMRPM